MTEKPWRTEPAGFVTSRVLDANGEELCVGETAQMRRLVDLVNAAPSVATAIDARFDEILRGVIFDLS